MTLVRVAADRYSVLRGAEKVGTVERKGRKWFLRFNGVSNSYDSLQGIRTFLALVGGRS